MFANPLVGCEPPPQRELPRFHRGIRWIGAIWLATVLLGAVVYGFRRPLLTAVASAIVVNDSLAPADFIFVLGGDTHLRLAHAAKLFRQGIAPRVVIMAAPLYSASVPGTNSDPAYPFVQIIREHGAPDSAITVLRIRGVDSTRDEGRVLRKYLQVNPALRAIVVTSAYHTRRARWTIRRELRGIPTEIRVSASPDPGFNASTWWQTEAGFVAYITEAIKFVHTLLRS